MSTSPGDQLRLTGEQQDCPLMCDPCLTMVGTSADFHQPAKPLVSPRSSASQRLRGEPTPDPQWRLGNK